MNTFSRAAAAVLVAALALGGAVYLLGRTTPSVGGPTANPKASPSPATAPAPTQLPTSSLVSITSRQYGYTVSVPRYWGLQPANGMLDGMEPPWVNRETPSHPSAADTAVDFMEGFAGDHAGVPPGTFAVAASLTPPGATLGSWTTGTATAVCGSPMSQDAITVDGEAATLSTFAVCDGAHRLWVTALHGGYAWHIVWLDLPGAEAADAVFFEQVLATFRFGEVLPNPSPS